MPEFLSEYISELSAVIEHIKEATASQHADIMERVLIRHWLPMENDENFISGEEVLAVDSSSAKHSTDEGGVFYVARAMALSRHRKYKKVSVGYDYSPNFNDLPLISRIMEHLEHTVALNAVEDGFKGVILIDGSLYGRISHLLKESDFARRRALMIDYFETLHSFLDACRRNRIIVVGISKESRTSFFRTFIVGKTLEALGIEERDFLMRAAVERVHLTKALRIAEKSGVENMLRDVIHRRPDFQMILKYARRGTLKTGCTTPLLLGATPRWHREFEKMRDNPYDFIRKRFPISSATDRNFIEHAINVLNDIEDLPAIVSFHVLPALNDTPMRVDVPAWVFNIDKRMCDVRMPVEFAANDEALKRILMIISAGYCDVNNYNVWLSAVDSAVKLHKDVFEIYLRKFEELTRMLTARGDRRARFP